MLQNHLSALLTAAVEAAAQDPDNHEARARLYSQRYVERHMPKEDDDAIIDGAFVAEIGNGWTLAGLDDEGPHRQAEGIVIRTDDRALIAKARRDDYRSTLQKVNR